MAGNNIWSLDHQRGAATAMVVLMIALGLLAFVTALTIAVYFSPQPEP